MPPPFELGVLLLAIALASGLAWMCIAQVAGYDWPKKAVAQLRAKQSALGESARRRTTLSLVVLAYLLIIAWIDLDLDQSGDRKLAIGLLGPTFLGVLGAIGLHEAMKRSDALRKSADAATEAARTSARAEERAREFRLAEEYVKLRAPVDPLNRSFADYCEQVGRCGSYCPIGSPALLARRIWENLENLSEQCLLMSLLEPDPEMRWEVDRLERRVRLQMTPLAKELRGLPAGASCTIKDLDPDESPDAALRELVRRKQESRSIDAFP